MEDDQFDQWQDAETIEAEQNTHQVLVSGEATVQIEHHQQEQNHEGIENLDEFGSLPLGTQPGSGDAKIQQQQVSKGMGQVCDLQDEPFQKQQPDQNNIDLGAGIQRVENNSQTNQASPRPVDQPIETAPTEQPNIEENDDEFGDYEAEQITDQTPAIPNIPVPTSETVPTQAYEAVQRILPLIPDLSFLRACYFMNP